MVDKITLLSRIVCFQEIWGKVYLKQILPCAVTKALLDFVEINGFEK